MTFAELAVQVQRDYDARLTCAVIAQKLIDAKIPPALGASVWSKELVDRVLTHYASQQQALEREK